ncbi:hypothetical protein [Thermomonas carbonis]|uniref:Uncharacterized protein n=1 Tax=Thermomonas carbonis TaxID=1463158 RepID=A0A7G9SPK4_9GAMM|nr:hypothetical protein [Thermomonas carbonis]QNN69779.1 hypothetical protein H9L16_14165 [Thermomonas carbonis]GHB95433.1 hypothetical protein GCM10010080_03670 [Thermomonas carbonis]
MNRIKAGVLVRAFLLLALAVLPAQATFAQSTDPDAPTLVTEHTISGINASNLSEDNTYYYAFDVRKGTLTWTLDLMPTNRSDAGGVLQWTLLTPKFDKLKYENLSAQGSPARQVKDLPITIKRRIIVKLVVSGNASYKIKLSGSAVDFGEGK